jgi:hypothetical protein
VKYPTNSIAWYRRTFDLPKEDEGKRIWLTFDGVMHDATVWINGWCVKRHEGGYYPFREDITDVVHFGGRNTVAVRVDATESEGWFYEGAGIYRHVWLDKTAPVAIAPDGIFVSSRPPNGCTVVEIQAQIQNTKNVETYEDNNVYVNFEVIDPGGKSVGEFRQRVGQPAGKDAFGKDNLELKAGSQQQVKAYFNFYRRPHPTVRPKMFLLQPNFGRPNLQNFTSSSRQLRSWLVEHSWKMECLTAKKLNLASAPWALTRRTAFC